MGQGSGGSGLLRIGTWMKEFGVLRKSGDLGFLWWVSFLFLGMFELFLGLIRIFQRRFWCFWLGLVSFLAWFWLEYAVNYL